MKNIRYISPEKWRKEKIRFESCIKVEEEKVYITDHDIKVIWRIIVSSFSVMDKDQGVAWKS